MPYNAYKLEFIGYCNSETCVLRSINDICYNCYLNQVTIVPDVFTKVSDY